MTPKIARRPASCGAPCSAFCAAGDDLACVQACLCIDNTTDSWLARLFTAEYAGQFDVFLPGIAALRLPLPLGGSSNHFRTATLRADRRLGSLQRHRGCRSRHAARALRLSHAASSIPPPMRKRRRVSVRGCASARAGSKAGCRLGWCICANRAASCAISACPALLAFQLMVGGNALAALVHPLFLGGLIYGVLASGAPMWKGGGAAAAILAGLYGTTLVIGYATSAFLGWLGLARRGLLSTAWVLAAHAAALAAAVACRLARAFPACGLTLSLGKNRAWSGEELAAGRQRFTHRCSCSWSDCFSGLKETGNRTGACHGAEPTYTSAVRRRTPQAAA